MLITIAVLVGLALLFDFINGFHDTANSIATIIATKVLTPWQALLWAALFNFLAFFIFPLKVAATIGSGIVYPEFINNISIAAALLAAIMFNLITWGFKIPSSSSHALIGALMGVGLMQGGAAGLHWPVLNIIFASVIVSPLLGIAVAFILVKTLPPLIPARFQNKFSSFLQLCSSALLSLGHGGNDAQKTMGIIVVLLYSNGYLSAELHPPLWVILSCYLVIALGTLAGGWRIIKTMAFKITALKPPSGACAELGAAFTLFTANHLGIPISTTHAITGSIIGVSTYSPGSFKTKNLRIVKQIVSAWVLTFPVSALFAAFIFWMLQLFVK